MSGKRPSAACSSIHWHLMFRVAHRRAFDRCLARTLPLLGAGSRVVAEGKPYWKMPELWECRVEGPGAKGSAAEQAYECLVIALGLGVGWHVLGSISADRADDFSGVWDVRGNHSHVPGLEWASFDLIPEAESRAASATVRTRGKGRAR